MFRKTILLAIFMLGLGARTWAATPHEDYAKMSIPDCNGCHQSNGIAPNHGSIWVKEHRLYAEKEPSNCKACHQQSFCLDCHTGGGIDRDLHASTSGVDYMPKSHRTDFREIHPIKAFDDPNSCYRCHDQKRFCVDCHEKFNPNDLRFLSHRRGFSDIEVSAGGPQHSTFTPAQCQTCHPGSVLPTHNWTDSHAKEARRNLSSCQSCHADGETCLKCHSAVSGLKINPHPKNWGRIADRLKQYGKNKSCVKCHS
ncbi:MAG: cytochrome C [Nitrospirae bacterium]|nr:cytochrome C [Nitrospirota bacterium]